MTGRQLSASSNSKQDIQDAEFEEVRDYPEPKQWAPSTAGSAGAGFTEYIFDLVMRRPILKWWMWIVFIAGNSYVLQKASELFGLGFEVPIWPDLIIVTNNIGAGLFWSAVIASILCWKWRGQVKREKASKQQAPIDRSRGGI